MNRHSNLRTTPLCLKHHSNTGTDGEGNRNWCCLGQRQLGTKGMNVLELGLKIRVSGFIDKTKSGPWGPQKKDVR